MFSKSFYFLIISIIQFSMILPLVAQDDSELINTIMHQEIDKAKALIEKGADVNVQDKSSGSTPLIMCCQYNFVDLAKLLIEKGADVNLQANNGYTPLIAAAGVSEELVDLLLLKKADINLKSETGTGPLKASIMGVIRGRVTTAVVKKLLDKGADINESATKGRTEGYTALMTAARNNEPKLVEFLVKEGADLNLKAKDGSTALSLAQKKDHQEMVKLLKKLGAK